jgi:hypothetical protein
LSKKCIYANENIRIEASNCFPIENKYTNSFIGLCLGVKKKIDAKEIVQIRVFNYFKELP